MKKNLIFLLFLSWAMTSCGKEKVQAPLSVQEQARLQQVLDADPDVILARKCFFEHQQLFLSIPTDERLTLIKALEACPVTPFARPLAEWKSCFTGLPYGDEFTSAMLKMKEYQALVETVKSRYPAFAQATIEERSALLVKSNLPEVKDLIQISKQNK
ncbi:MAG: hypothetical protein IT260_01015 [Saprospiraceae bacterium]|nr:hypothetical protein [Saprospiraceae bacterium]